MIKRVCLGLLLSTGCLETVFAANDSDVERVLIAIRRITKSPDVAFCNDIFDRWDEEGKSDEPAQQRKFQARLAYLHENEEDPAVLVLLGSLYVDGCGSVEQDSKKAEEFFKRAADKGSVFAQGYLGHVYQTQGRRDEAILLLQLASNAGVEAAQEALDELLSDESEVTTPVQTSDTCVLS